MASFPARLEVIDPGSGIGVWTANISASNGQRTLYTVAR
jgi:hypothetical protein